MKKTYAALTMLLVVMSGVVCAQDPPVEHKLAMLNTGTYAYVKADSAVVARFRYLLKSISGKTVNSRSEIGNMTVGAQEILLKEYGKKVSLLEIMEQGNAAIPGGRQKYKYNEVLVLLISLMGK